MEAKLDERLLLVHIKLSEDLSRVEEVLVLEYPVSLCQSLVLGAESP